MKLNKLHRILTALAAVILTHAALAEDPPVVIDATDPELIASIMQELGYRAKLEVDNDGEPVIRSGVGGSQFSIQFFSCTADKHDQCEVILFAISYNLEGGSSDERMNAWNKAALFDRSYLDDESDPALELGINMDGGVSRESFENTVGIWARRVGEFEKHIGF